MTEIDENVENKTGDSKEKLPDSSGKIKLSSGKLTLGSGLKLNKEDILKKINRSSESSRFVLKKGLPEGSAPVADDNNDDLSDDEMVRRSALVRNFAQKTKERAEELENERNNINVNANGADLPSPLPSTLGSVDNSSSPSKSLKLAKDSPKKKEKEKEKEKEKPTKGFKDSYDKKKPAPSMQAKRVKKVSISNITIAGGDFSDIEATSSDSGTGFSKVFGDEKVLSESEKLAFRFKSTGKDGEEEEEDPTAKVDNRDKTIINAIIQKYRYLEFDKDEEIAELEKGLELRNVIEETRIKNADASDVVSIVSEPVFVSKASENGKNRRKNSRAYGSRNRRKARTGPFLQKAIEITGDISISLLAKNMAIKTDAVIAKLRNFGANYKSVDTIIDADTAELIVEEFGHVASRGESVTAEDKIRSRMPEVYDENSMLIPPVVTVMGHVDHGKTSMLDALRSTNVTDGESGGITQHIGAYQVGLPDFEDKKITFIDTPGHEAFSSIRARGSSVTDVVVLVVACDDGVKPQTIEAIEHAKFAEVPIVVAITKMDKSSNIKADIERIKAELAGLDVISEDLGGDALFVPVSSVTRENFDKLLEAILMQAEMLDLRAHLDGQASGVILEGKLDKKRGILATALVKNGSLKIGDVILAGDSYGKVRAMLTHDGSNVTEAGPSVPVEIYGMNSPLIAGFGFNVVDSEKVAREILEHRKRKLQALTFSKVESHDFEKRILEAQNKKDTFNVIIRADMQGTLDAIKSTVGKISVPDLNINIIQATIGSVTEADILLSVADNAVILTFRPLGFREAELAKKKEVKICSSTIIYELLDELKKLISATLPPVEKINDIGEAEIRMLFNITKVGKIAGCMVKKGIVKRGAFVRLLRNDVAVGTDYKIKTLKHFKTDVKEIGMNHECGIQLEGFEEMCERDKVFIFEKTYETRLI